MRHDIPTKASRQRHDAANNHSGLGDVALARECYPERGAAHPQPHAQLHQAGYGHLRREAAFRRPQHIAELH